MKKGLVAIALLTFFLVACPNSPVPIVSGTDCKAAEARLKELGCISKEKPYTVKGKSFSQFCEETMKNGIDLNPRCISNINKCDEVNACVQGR